MQTIVKEFHRVLLALPETWNPSEWLCQIQFISESPVCWDIRIYEHLEKGELEKRPHPSWEFALGCDHLAELETVKKSKGKCHSNIVFNDTWRLLIVPSEIILKRCTRSKLNIILDWMNMRWFRKRHSGKAYICDRFLGGKPKLKLPCDFDSQGSEYQSVFDRYWFILF